MVETTVSFVNLAGAKRESMDDGTASPCRPPLISPEGSLSRSDSCVSSCSEYSVDVNSYSRVNQEKCTIKNSQQDLTHSVDGPLHNLSLSTPVNNKYRSSTAMENNLMESSNNDNSIRNTINGVDNRQTSYNEERREIGVRRTSGSSVVGTEMYNLSGNQTNEEIWEPPEAEDSEDDMEGSVTNFDDDDDDEYGDGIKWGKPSSLGSYGEDSRGSYNIMEEREKVKDDVCNGKFKDLVIQLLKSVGVDTSGKDGECWVDIVTSLSWEAASFLKPEAIDGKSMDPEDYMKVKCIATGFPNQSQLIKGLVFKKHAAHKHMPVKYKNPSLLLIRGMLGLSPSSLSSFVSMNEEKEYLKSVIDMIDMCHPDLILVEKSVSRDVQESILAKGKTLVFDMKLHRLERVARCTGSPIISSDTLINHKLKHFDYFHIEKFVEEHAASEGEKKPSKTLMFLEGCPSHQGCTILLKGSHSNELKKVKCVVQCTIVMAYQLIVEISFLVDQKAMFSTIPSNKTENVMPTEDSTAESVPSSTMVDIPIANGFHEEANNLSLKFEDKSPFSYKPYNPVILSGFSSLSESMKKVIADRFPLVSSTSYPSLSSYFGFNEKESHIHDTQTVLIKDQCDMDSKGSSDEEKSVSLSIECESPLETEKSEDQVKSKDNIATILEAQSILVLMSSRNAYRGTLCDQSHFSHIKFYRNFDIPLGKFLRDNILNQKKMCSTCNQLPEAHFYYYAHQREQLTIQVNKLQEDKCLPGETEGKLWMWSRCGKCNASTGTSKSTKRVVISTTARGLSFGKFLELNFSHYSSRFSRCGHSQHGDFFHFFGLGPMVAMLSYSPVATYTVSMPAKKLEFNNSVKQESLQKEIMNVFMKEKSLFSEVEKSLQKLGSKYKGLILELHGSLKEFPDIELMLNQERSQFEIRLENTIVKNGIPEGYKFLLLNQLLWELLLQAFIWDQRLLTLLSPGSAIIRTSSTDNPKQEITLNNTIDVMHNSDDLNISVETCEEAEESNQDFIVGPHLSPTVHDKLLADIDIPISSESGDIVQSKVDATQDSLVSNLERSEGWMWAPFSELCQSYTNDLKRSVLPIFTSTIPEHLPSLHQLITEEASRIHVCVGDNDYIVSDYEGELSSVIACALTMLQDQPFLVEYHKTIDTSKSMTRLDSMTTPHMVSYGSSNSNGFISKSVSFDESRLSSFDGLNLFDSLTSFEALHPEIPLGTTKLHGKGKYSVVCIYARRFFDLRSRCCSSEHDYIASLSRCRNWDAKGGKSKAIFAKTLDDRFIIKEIKKTESDSFMKFAPDYFNYINHSFESGSQTCLAKVLGIYQVVIRQPKSGKEVKHDLMVMENLSYGRKISRQYDLKGALHARLNAGGDSSEDVLLDQNFVNDMNASPLYVSNKANHHLQRAVWNDTTFLNSINVMDYSLLVGVDSDNRELVCGIIDYLRQYTWDKQLETWAKSSLVVPKNILPTVISPKEYKKRFRKFMSTHFLSVPDDWCSKEQNGA